MLDPVNMMNWCYGEKTTPATSIPIHQPPRRMLYETAERFELKHSKAFVNINYSIPPYQHPIRALTRGSVRGFIGTKTSKHQWQEIWNRS